MRDERRDIGGQESLTLAESHDQRELRRAPTRVSGSSADAATKVNAPRNCWQVRCIASVRSALSRSSTASRCAATSVSVSLRNLTPPELS